MGTLLEQPRVAEHTHTWDVQEITADATGRPRFVLYCKGCGGHYDPRENHHEPVVRWVEEGITE